MKHDEDRRKQLGIEIADERRKRRDAAGRSADHYETRFVFGSASTHSQVLPVSPQQMRPLGVLRVSTPTRSSRTKTHAGFTSEPRRRR
jgi:hypothetical protein